MTYDMKRVVILGPGASGKSTLAVHLGEITGIPVVKLDKVFWGPGLVAMPPDRWAKVQTRLVEKNAWIMDGDLGPYDVVEIRLHAADTIIFLDFSLIRCAWRAFWRSRERIDFWLWLSQYRLRSRPFLMEAVRNHAPNAQLHVFQSPRAVARFVTDLCRSYEPAVGLE